MSGSREEILGRIRRTLGERHESPAAEHGAIPRGYRMAGELDQEGRLALFVERLTAYQVGVYRCAPDEIAPTIARALTERGKRRMLVAHDVPRAWLPPGFQFGNDEELTYAELDQSEGVLTACTLAIALTGSIVLHHGRAEGRRALTLIPDYHVCVVAAEQVVETVPQGIRRIASLEPKLVTTIAGPSATADIEMTRIRGVHGPRTLDVILAAEHGGFRG